MQISKAQAVDIPELSWLLQILFSQEAEFVPDDDKQTRGLAMIIENAECGQIFVARIDQRIVGMISLLFTPSTALGAKAAIIEDMIIAPDLRGLGIGSALLKQAIAFAKAQNCKRISLLTDADNYAAQTFYQLEGFQTSKMLCMRLKLDA